MTTINDWFNKVFIINLDRRTDRWAFCEHECQRYGLDAERFPGIDWPAEHHYGCTNSHRSLLRLVAESDWERVLVLEDDFKVISREDLVEAGFEDMANGSWRIFTSLLEGHGDLNQRFSVIEPHIPDDWDVLYLGGAYGQKPLERVNPHILRVGYVQTTSSYGITRKHAQEWTRLADAQGPMSVHLGPIDLVFCNYAPTHRYYMVQPRLMFQRASKSDITGEWNNYLMSMVDSAHEEAI